MTDQQPTLTMAGTEWNNIVDFVERSTYRIWNEGEIDLIARMYTPHTITHMDGGDIIGADAVIADSTSRLGAWKGFRGVIDDTIWTGNDRDGYRTSMRWTWTGKNVGDTVFGGPSGRDVRFSVIANCVVLGELYVEEWKAWNPRNLAGQVGVAPDVAVERWQQAVADAGYDRTEGRPAEDFGVRVPAVPERIDGPGEVVLEHLTTIFGKGDLGQVHKAYADQPSLHVGVDRSYHGPAGVRLRGLVAAAVAGAGVPRRRAVLARGLQRQPGGGPVELGRCGPHSAGRPGGVGPGREPRARARRPDRGRVGRVRRAGAAAPAAGTVTRGLLWAGAGVVAFSLTLPVTAIGLRGLDPLLLGAGRCVLAALVAAAWLVAVRAPLPGRTERLPLVWVGIGAVVGFGVLPAFALQHVTSGHAALVVGALPLVTAVFAAVRGGERPHRATWIGGAAGSGVVTAFVLFSGPLPGRIGPGDLLLLGTLVLGALGYAEGGRLASTMPGAQVIAWGLVIALPLSLAATAYAAVTHPPTAAGGGAWAAFGYTAVIAMFLGYVAWYRGLAAVGVARGSQIQLLQPLLTVLWSVLLLGEQVTPLLGLAMLATTGCVVLAQRGRGADPPSRRGVRGAPDQLGVEDDAARRAGLLPGHALDQ
ncbi:EamA family transporter [Pseudonocardia nigra]|uniref:EamA family transporter n=1 Tax=Pseudonocardia nigra TaxID=1921578 RepID=UPI001C5D9CD2|nr:EamA family transporter [Pseudonocardia nigra]